MNVLAFLGAILFLLAIFVLLVVIIGYLLSCKPYQGPVSDHFDGKRFINPSRRPANGLKEVSEYGRKRQPDKWTYKDDPDYKLRTIPQPTQSGVQFTFINHSSFLIQLAECNILTDPIWSKRCSPFQWGGPRRMRPPGIAFEKLPNIDLVLLSHNHYDHLDKNTIKRLVKEHDPTFIVPLGLLSQMKKYGCSKVYELDWWQHREFNQLNITATPANHFSSRGLFDRDKTLWAGFIIKAQGFKIYYTGDTGYSDIFKEIGRKEGPFDLSFIPIGAYKPEWFMSPIHVSPDEAIQVHKDVGSKQSIAMHFGTFPLADDNPERSTSRLKLCLAEDPCRFMIPTEGKSYLLDKDRQLRPNV